MDLVERAMVFATAAHAAVGQKRKYTGEDYIVHPAAVVKIVSSVPHDGSMLAAAYLHDVVEDTQVSHQLICDTFGAYISRLVWWLTDISKPEDGNREFRKEMDREHMAKAWPEAKTIKLADLIHNTESIIEYDPDFAVTYVREKEKLLDVLQEGDATLMARAKMQLEIYTGIIH